MPGRRTLLAAALGLLALLVGFPLFAQPAPFQFQDSFTGYPPGSDGSPAWLAHSIHWSVTEGAYHCAEPLRSFSLVARAPAGRTVTVEATLRVTGTVAAQWKTAGVTVFADERNYWHLALVEAPPSERRRHFVELAEMLDGTWNAHQGTVREIENIQGDTPWQTGETYRLHLALTPEGISGAITSTSGAPVARLEYAFTGPAVTWGRPGLACSGFAADFGAVQVSVAGRVAVPAPSYPPYWGAEGRTRLPGASGFFRVVRREGKWWLQDPNGRRFWARGTDHANWQVHWCEQLGYAPYHRNVAALYGPEERWAALACRRLQSWGFNALGVNSSPSLRHRGLPHLDLLGLGTGFAASECIVPQGNWTGFPDVFSPRWAAHCDRQARLLCAPQRDDPWLVGYFIDNELEWLGKSWQPGGLVTEAMKLPPDRLAKRALVDLLRRRYGDIRRFNRAWGVQLAGFADLEAGRELSPHTAAALRDSREFVRMAAERYFRVAAAAIRRHDPHHLVLGCRFAGTAPEVWDLAGRYCDVVSVNCYRSLDLDTAQVLGFAQDLRRWHQQSGRPLLITEWSFPALDSGLPCQHGAGQRFATQEQRARAFAIFQELLLRTPFVVGSNYFMWADEPALGIASTFPEDSNYGLVDEQDRPYPAITAAARRVHVRWQALHHQGSAPAPRPPSPPTYRRGAPWSVPGRLRLPLLVWSPERPAGTYTVSAPLRELWPGFPAQELAGRALALVDQTEGQPVPLTFQVDPLGEEPELVWRTRLDSPRRCFLYLAAAPLPRSPAPARLLSRAEDELRVSVGPLVLAHREGSPDFFDRLTYQGTPVGRLMPLLWQQAEASHWDEHHRVSVAASCQGPLRATVDFLVTNTGELPYRAGYRLHFYPDRTWFASRCLWVENTSPGPWTLSRCYHYCRSAIGGEDRDDLPVPNVPSYYLPFAAWQDSGLGLALGALSPRLGELELSYWKDERGTEHSDFAYRVERLLAPGERYAERQPEGVLFVAPAPAGLAAEAISQELKAIHAARFRGQAPEAR